MRIRLRGLVEPHLERKRLIIGYMKPETTKQAVPKQMLVLAHPVLNAVLIELLL